MKYKALLIGENNAIIDDFFYHMYDDFDVMSCHYHRFGGHENKMEGSHRFDDLLLYVGGRSFGSYLARKSNR